MHFTTPFKILFFAIAASAQLAKDIKPHGNETVTVAGIKLNSHNDEIIKPAEFRDDECQRALEIDLGAGNAADDGLLSVGPPDYFCCDGYTGQYHTGSGKRLCCHISAQCCNIDVGSTWSIRGGIKSFRPMAGSDVLYLKEQKNCGAGGCHQCINRSTLPSDFPPWRAMKRWDCASSSTRQK